MNILVALVGLSILVSTQARAEGNDVRAMTAVQSAGSLTPNTWTTELLNYQAKALTEKGETAAKQAYIAHGGDVNNFVSHGTYESNFVVLKGEKFGIITTRMSMGSKNLNIMNKATTKRVSVIRGGDLISVTCAEESDRDILLNSGPCEEAIKKTLGVTFSVFPTGANSSEMEGSTSPAIAATAAAASTFGTTMLIGIVGVVLASIPLIWVMRKNKRTKGPSEYREGYLAFQNALGEDSNPYAGQDERQAKSWIEGYKDARLARQEMH